MSTHPISLYLQLQMSLPDVGALRLADTSGPRVGCFGPLPALCRLAGVADARRILDLPVRGDEAVLALGLQVCPHLHSPRAASRVTHEPQPPPTALVLVPIFPNPSQVLVLLSS